MPKEVRKTHTLSLSKITLLSLKSSTLLYSTTASDNNHGNTTSPSILRPRHQDQAVRPPKLHIHDDGERGGEDPRGGGVEDEGGARGPVAPRGPHEVHAHAHDVDGRLAPQGLDGPFADFSCGVVVFVVVSPPGILLRHGRRVVRLPAVAVIGFDPFFFAGFGAT